MLFTNYFMTISNIIAIIYFTIVSSTCLSAKRLQVIDLQPFFCETTVPSHRFLTAIFVFETAIYPKGYNSASDELFYTRYGVI